MKSFNDLLQFRRSVRFYKDQPIDPELIKLCIEQATLAPNSSNMQLWEFYHITDTDILRELSKACLSQSAATTAQQMVVFVTRQDWYAEHAKTILKLETQNIQRNSPENAQKRRIHQRNLYYGRLMPVLYARCFGLIGLLRKALVNVVGLFRPIIYQVSENDMRVVVHKTCALAAQTFMLAMANQGLDTCPMEGFDSRMVKRILKLPSGAEVNMIISCGIRDEKGVWGDRIRISFDEVYKRV